MATDVQSKPAKPATEPLKLPAQPAMKWWVVPLLAFGGLVLLVLLAVVVFVFKWRADSAAALARVKKEVARVEASGQPISIESLYAYHRVPDGVRDSTPLWIAALGTFDEKQFNIDGKSLPFVGDADSAALTPPGDAALLEAAGAFLQDYDSTREAILAAAKDGGVCRFPEKFEDGFSMRLSHVQKIRGLARFMALDLRVRVCRGDVAGALESLDALYAIARTVEHESTLVGQLVQMAVSGVAFSETEQLLNDVALSDEQLARIDQRLAAIDLQAGLNTGLIGERAMGFQAFHHLESIPEIPSGLRGLGGPGELGRPADCEWYLKLMGAMVDASQEPMPASRQKVKAVENELRQRAGSKNVLERMQYMVTLMILPAVSSAFEASARATAAEDTLRVAVAAERYRLKTGEFPKQIADLVPAYLPAVPIDPYDGLPLRMKTTAEEVLVYSVGKDGKDNGGLELKLNEPDQVVKVRAKKGAAATPDSPPPTPSPQP